METVIVMIEYAVLFALTLKVITMSANVLQMGTERTMHVLKSAKKALLVAANNASDK